MASRLDAIAPPGFAIRSDAVRVVVDGRHGPADGSSAAVIVADTDGRSAEELVETAARAVLSGVQDCVVQESGSPWPPAHGGLPLPGARTRGGSLYLWYGDEQSPDAVLAPIELSEIIG